MEDTAARQTDRQVFALRPEEPSWRTVQRRCFTVPLFLIAAVFVVLLTPVVVPVAFVVDLAARRRLATVRTWLMVLTFFVCEACGILASLWIRVGHRDGDAFVDANYRLEFWWAGTLYRAGMRLFSLKLDVEGVEAAAEGPLLVFSRHVSPIDNVLPVALISLPYRHRLRWVINRSLLRDPCIDIVGNRLPNCFVAGGRDDSEAEVRRVAALARNLGPRDGVMIFPEGGLFSPARRERILARLEAAGEAALFERAGRLQNVLPPRLGGSLALLEAAEGVDAVFFAHTGLEEATKYADILGGRLIGHTIRVKMWRVPSEDIPPGLAERAEWLAQQWERLDRWVSEQRGEQDA